jgi:hypothetical protein
MSEEVKHEIESIIYNIMMFLDEDYNEGKWSEESVEIFKNEIKKIDMNYKQVNKYDYVKNLPEGLCIFI